MTHRAKTNLAPGCISDMTEPYNRTELNLALRSLKQNRLDEKWLKHERSGDRASSVCEPKLWNLLSLKTRKLLSVDLFKTELKTNLLKKSIQIVTLPRQTTLIYLGILLLQIQNIDIVLYLVSCTDVLAPYDCDILLFVLMYLFDQCCNYLFYYVMIFVLFVLRCMCKALNQRIVRDRVYY